MFVRKAGSGISCDWSIYTIRSQRAVRVATDTIGWDFVVCPGIPYVATHIAGYESWFSKLYNTGNPYKLAMEVSYGESDEADNWGDKDTYTYIVTNGSLLHFVNNTYENRSGYAAAGISTGFVGTPDTAGNYSSWLYNNLR